MKLDKLNGRLRGPSMVKAVFHHIQTPSPTPQGGTHESGVRGALLKGIKAYGELIGNKKGIRPYR